LLRIHITSEVAQECSHLGRWVKEQFLPWIEARAKEGEPSALMLGTFVPGLLAEAVPTWEHVVDSSVYAPYGVLLLPGNRKPGGRVLRQLRLTSVQHGGYTPMKDHELMYVAQPSYAMDHGDESKFLKWGRDPKAVVQSLRDDVPVTDGVEDHPLHSPAARTEARFYVIDDDDDDDDDVDPCDESETDSFTMSPRGGRKRVRAGGDSYCCGRSNKRRCVLLDAFAPWMERHRQKPPT
jgi:hypothetical protein